MPETTAAGQQRGRIAATTSERHPWFRRCLGPLLLLLLTVLTGAACTGYDAPAPMPVVATPVVTPTSAPLKVGVLVSTPGAFSPDGLATAEGLKLAWGGEQGITIAGRKLEPIFEDTEGNPDLALTKFRKLVEQDSVSAVVGPASDGEVQAILGYAAARGVPLVLPFTPTDPTGLLARTPSAFQVAGTLQSQAVAGWFAAKQLNAKRAVVVVSDYPAGLAAAARFRQSFEAAGGAIGAEIRLPLGVLDVKPYLSQVGAAAGQADLTVLPNVIGEATSLFAQAYAEAGLDRRAALMAPVASTLANPIPPSAPPLAAAISYGDWSPILDTPVNKAFVDNFLKAYKKAPTVPHLYGYLAGRAVVEALTTLKGAANDPTAVVSALQSVTFAGPAGPFRFDPQRQAIATVYLLRTTSETTTLATTVENVDSLWSAPK